MLEYLRTVAMSRRGGEDGASGVEYGLLIAAIAAIVLVAAFALGNLVSDTFSDTCGNIATADGGAPPDPNCTAD